MKIKITSLLFILALVSSFILPENKDENQGINGYYKSYGDYKAKKLQKMDEGKGTMHVFNTLYVRFKKDGKVEKIKCGDIWGFMFKSRLFRIDHTDYGDYPCAVVRSGKIVYYENGSAHIDALVNNTDVGYGSSGHLYYFSKNLNSPIMSVSSASEYQAFASSFRSAHKKLIECIESNPPSREIYRNCAIEYNKTEADSSAKK